jgi:hypothetical protein
LGIGGSKVKVLRRSKLEIRSPDDPIARHIHSPISFVIYKLSSGTSVSRISTRVPFSDSHRSFTLFLSSSGGGLPGRCGFSRIQTPV